MTCPRSTPAMLTALLLGACTTISSGGFNVVNPEVRAMEPRLAAIAAGTSCGQPLILVEDIRLAMQIADELGRKSTGADQDDCENDPRVSRIVMRQDNAPLYLLVIDETVPRDALLCQKVYAYKPPVGAAQYNVTTPGPDTFETGEFCRGTILGADPDLFPEQPVVEYEVEAEIGSRIPRGGRSSTARTQSPGSGLP